MTFAVFNVHCHLAINMCINCSFVHLYLQFYYIYWTILVILVYTLVPVSKLFLLIPLFGLFF